MVTKSTIPNLVWSLPKSNVTIDLGFSYTKPKAIIAGVSREFGLDLI